MHQKCISFLQKLIQIPSVNSLHGEEKVVRAIEEEAIALNLPFQIIQKNIKRPNIFVGEAESFVKNDSLLFVAHTDTVGTGEASLWKHSPFSAVIEGDRLYGRGAIDCKGGIALSLYALKALKDLGQLHRAKFIGVVDEESGASSDLGLKFVLERGLGAKGAVYTYGGGPKLHESINIGHRGVLRVEITFKGKNAHSGSLEWQNRTHGRNAIEPLLTFMQLMTGLDFPGTDPHFPGYEFISTPTLLKAGVGESIVPDEATVLYDIRILPKHSEESILSKIEALAKEAASGYGFRLKVKVKVSAALSDPASPFIQTVSEVHEEIFGNRPLIKGSGPANESYMLIQKKIPTVAGYGFSGDGFHAIDEYADLKTFEKSLTFLIQLALKAT